MERRTRARALAGFFAAGALVSTTVIVLPGWEQVDTTGIAATIVAAAAGSLGLYLWAERTNQMVIHAMTVTGTALIGACQIFARGGSPTAMYAMLYIWVILHSSLFSSRAVVGAYLGLTTAVHVVALVWLGDLTAIGPQLALTLVTQVSTALIVVSLVTMQRALAETDSLTGLGNRRVVDRTLDLALRPNRLGQSSSAYLALLDLDGFKVFNDRLGHTAGDNMLVEAAAAWGAHLRSTDILARVGGDEFVLVLLDCRFDQAVRTVRRLLDATPAGVTCSAGLARWDGHESAQRLFDRADAALYDAKSEGPLSVAA